MRFDRLTSSEAVAALAARPVALLALGAIENHGEHLPLGTDNDLAQGVVDAVEARIPDALVLPPVAYGQAWSTAGFPGTLSLSVATLQGLIVDLGVSLRRQGVEVLALVNGHMGNLDAMKLAARQLHDEHDMTVLTLTYPGTSAVQEQVLEAERWHGTYFHADEMETSLMLHLAPGEVRMELAQANYPERPATFDVTPTPWTALSDTPVIGDPRVATAEKGRAIVEAAVEAIVALIGHARAARPGADGAGRPAGGADAGAPDGGTGSAAAEGR
jgi:creatinine amidohydrolase